ncbi:hypothetical protein FACS1894199_00480 [Bacteroidia bacterium]|nr:hypothetical protein FACS1894199_00480 [Bacteroidia bacterium]
MKTDTKQHIEALIERYFDGLTTLKEEKWLRNYFQTANVSEEWKGYQPMFQFFAAERKPIRKNTRMRNVRWVSMVAAASVLLVLGLKFAFEPPTDIQNAMPAYSLAYVNGEKYTNIDRIKSEVVKTLENFADKDEDVYSSQIEAIDFFLKK